MYKFGMWHWQRRYPLEDAYCSLARGGCLSCIRYLSPRALSLSAAYGGLTSPLYSCTSNQQHLSLCLDHFGILVVIDTGITHLPMGFGRQKGYSASIAWPWRSVDKGTYNHGRGGLNRWTLWTGSGLDDFFGILVLGFGASRL